MDQLKNTLVKIIDSCFAEFSDNLKNSYQIGNKDFYTTPIKYKDRYGLNPWLLTEDDIKVKFGGILENYFLNNKCNFSIVYRQQRLEPG
ncbi:MAG: hypothetical protein ABFS38_22295 [Bacteroidota bacterium]